MGFVALGLAPGDKVAILSENRREWLYAELAAMAAGAVGVGVYPTSPSNEVQYVLAHSGATIVVAEDQEQVDKILEVGDRLPAVRHIVVPETKGLRSYEDPRLVSWEELEARGERLAGRAARPLRGAGRGHPPRRRGLPHLHLGHHRLPQGGHDLPPQRARPGPGRRRGHRDRREPTRWSPTCPLCHVAEQIFSVYLPLHLGMTVSFAEGIRTIQEDLREIAPTVFLGVPRIWEKMQAGIQVKIQETGRLRRALFEGAMARGPAARRAPPGRGAGRGARAARPRRSTTCSCSARCRTTSACGGPGPPSRPPPPSPPRCCSSSTPWASRCARATG